MLCSILESIDLTLSVASGFLTTASASKFTSPTQTRSSIPCDVTHANIANGCYAYGCGKGIRETREQLILKEKSSRLRLKSKSSLASETNTKVLLLKPMHEPPIRCMRNRLSVKMNKGNFAHSPRVFRQISIICRDIALASSPSLENIPKFALFPGLRITFPRHKPLGSESSFSGRRLNIANTNKISVWRLRLKFRSVGTLIVFHFIGIQYEGTDNEFRPKWRVYRKNCSHNSRISWTVSRSWEMWVIVIDQTWNVHLFGQFIVVRVAVYLRLRFETHHSDFVCLFSPQEIRAIVKDIDASAREAALALQVIHASITGGKSPTFGQLTDWNPKIHSQLQLFASSVGWLPEGAWTIWKMPWILRQTGRNRPARSVLSVFRSLAFPVAANRVLDCVDGFPRGRVLGDARHCRRNSWL